MFISAVLGYLQINKEELGFAPTIIKDNARYIYIHQNGWTRRLRLEDLIKQQRSITSRATTYQRGSLGDKLDGGIVIKDLQEFKERPKEGLLLKEVIEAGVKNVAQYYHYKTVRIRGKINDIRYNVQKGLSDANGRNPFQQQRPMLSKSVTSLTMSSSLRLGQGRSVSISRTIT